MYMYVGCEGRGERMRLAGREEKSWPCNWEFLEGLLPSADAEILTKGFRPFFSY